MGLRPQLRIIANERDITATIMGRLIGLTLTDEAGMESDTCEFTLADHESAPIVMPSTGVELEVFLGYDNDVQKMGLYIVDEVELSGWPGTMTVRAKAAPYDKSKSGKTDLQSQKSRSWPKDTRLADLVAKIAQEHNMQPAVAQSLQETVLPHLDQTEESDISFLVRVAKRYDAIAKPAGGKIVVAKRGDSKSASGKDLPSIRVNAGDTTSWSMTLAKRDKPGSVVAYYHVNREAKREEITAGDGEPVRRLRHWYPDAGSARAAAQAELGKQRRGEKKLSLTMPGDPAIAAESPLVTVGFRDEVDGQWLVTRVTHSFTKSGGYQCSLEAEQRSETNTP